MNGQVPNLKGAEKDHKEDKSRIRMRPIMNAMDGPKKTISDLYSDILEAVVESNSTEELLEAFETFNKTKNNSSDDNSEYIIGSMDAVSLYPSLELERSLEIVKEEVIKSYVTFENVDTHELGIYLRKNLAPEYIKAKGYDKVLPRKVNENYADEDNDFDEEDGDGDEFLENIESLFNEEGFIRNTERETLGDGQEEKGTNDEIMNDIDFSDHDMFDQEDLNEEMAKKAEGICKGRNTANTSSKDSENSKKAEGICEEENTANTSSKDNNKEREGKYERKNKTNTSNKEKKKNMKKYWKRNEKCNV